MRIPYANGILDNPDYLATSTDICIWSTVEIGVALTATSLATLKPLMRKLRLFNMSSVRSYGQGSRRTQDNNRTGGTNGGGTNKRASRHVKTFSNGNHQVTISSIAPPDEKRRSKNGRDRDRKESMEMELVNRSTSDNSSRGTDGKTSWLDVV